MVPRRLADVEEPRIRPNQIQHIIRHQAIVEDEIGPLDRPHRLDRQQLRVPRPRPHQRHPPGATTSTSSCSSSAAAAPRGPQGLEKLLELGQLQSNLVVPVAGAAAPRGRRGGGGGVGPALSLVPLRGSDLREGGRGGEDASAAGAGEEGERGG